MSRKRRSYRGTPNRVRTRGAIKRQPKLDAGDKLVAGLQRPCPQCGAGELKACRNASGAEMLRLHPQR